MSDAITPDDLQGTAHDPDEGPPAAYLFGNGNAIFFDGLGNQITDYQELGLSGIYPFRHEYPEAPIYWAIWGHGPRSRAAEEVHENVFDYIEEPDIGSFDYDVFLGDDAE